MNNSLGTERFEFVAAMLGPDRAAQILEDVQRAQAVQRSAQEGGIDSAAGPYVDDLLGASQPARKQASTGPRDAHEAAVADYVSDSFNMPGEGAHEGQRASKARAAPDDLTQRVKAQGEELAALRAEISGLRKSLQGNTSLPSNTTPPRRKNR